MCSELPKVLHPLAGRPLLWHVQRAAAALRPRAIFVVCGADALPVRAALRESPEVEWVIQEEALGTGHAARLALERIPATDQVLLLCGDTPLLRSRTLASLLEEGGADALVVLTAVPETTDGYGRVLRGADNSLRGIVEEADATPEQRQLKEVNTGVLAAPAAMLGRLLQGLDRANKQGEYYLGDVVHLALTADLPVRTVCAPDPEESAGINTRVQLAAAERACRRRRALELMEQGLTLLDPERFDLRGELRCGRDVVIDINVVLEGEVHLGDGVHIGPHCYLRDVSLGEGVQVLPFSLLEETRVGKKARLGPYCRIRPGTHLEDEVRVGNFVELKNSRIGAGTRINHLSYLGDSEVGAQANIGAGVISCNYDGQKKHRTVIGAGAFIGSNCQLVAPIQVGAGAMVAAGTTVTKDVAPDSLAIGRVRQRNLRDWRRGNEASSGETDSGKS